MALHDLSLLSLMLAHLVAVTVRFDFCQHTHHLLLTSLLAVDHIPLLAGAVPENSLGLVCVGRRRL
jgi:hypothetical protein